MVIYIYLPDSRKYRMRKDMPSTGSLKYLSANDEK